LTDVPHATQIKDRGRRAAPHERQVASTALTVASARSGWTSRNRRAI
jgi:hypothetical protein